MLDLQDVVKETISLIRAGKQQNKAMVAYELCQEIDLQIAGVLQQTLNGMGFVALFTISGGLSKIQSSRMYIVIS